MAQYAPKRDQALLLYNSLSGEPEQELEYMDINEIYTHDGVQKILEALKRPLQQKAVYQKRRYLHEFESMRRYSGETMRAYTNRFRRSQRNLSTLGVDISATYDSEALGSRLLERSGLSHADQRMILVGTTQSLNFEAIAESLTLQYPDFRGAPPLALRDQSRDHGAPFAASSSGSGLKAGGKRHSKTPFTARPSAGGKGSMFHQKAVHLAENTEVREMDHSIDGDEYVDAMDDTQLIEAGDLAQEVEELADEPDQEISDEPDLGTYPDGQEVERHHFGSQMAV